MEHPLVSVLIPAYNAQRWIAETLRSVHAQTYSAVEVIVVDDGSTDQTAAVARNCGARVIEQPNCGPGVARNRAFAESRGDYIQWLDADDVLSPDKIERGVELLRDSEPTSVASCRWGRFTHDVAETRFVPEPVWRDLSALEFITSLLHGRGMQPTSTWLMPRNVVRRAGPWVEEYRSPIDDGEYICRVLAVSSGMRFEPHGVMYYRSNINGWSTVRTPSAIGGIFQSIQAMTATLLQLRDSSETRCAAAGIWQEFAYSNFPVRQDLVKIALDRARSLGGCPHIGPSGSPNFEVARRMIGWRAARRVQHLWRHLRQHRSTE